MRTIDSHQDSDITIEVLDEPGQGDACHEYSLTWGKGLDSFLCRLNFQKGPVKEVGRNGLSDAALAAVLVDRLEHFQAGPYACHENGQALAALQNALFAMHARTKARVERGVEGTSQK